MHRPATIIGRLLVMLLLFAAGLQAAEKLTAGSKGHAVPIRVENTSGKSIHGIRVEAANVPPSIANLRIQPASLAELKPGGSQTFTATFDIRQDAGAFRQAELSFKVLAKDAQFDVPMPTVQFDVAREIQLALVSLKAVTEGSGERPLTALGERIEDQWVLKYGRTNVEAHRDPGKKMTYAFQTQLRLPDVIKPGEDFAVGVCTSTAVKNTGEAFAGEQFLEHHTILKAGPTWTSSSRQYAVPRKSGEEAGSSQQAQIAFRIDPQNTVPFEEYTYGSELIGWGKSQTESFPPDLKAPLERRDRGSSLHWVLVNKQDPGILGQGNVVETAPPRLTVRVEDSLLYGFGNGPLYRKTVRREWIAEYRVLEPGEAAPKFLDPPFAVQTDCPQVRIAGGVAPAVRPPGSENRPPGPPGTLNPNAPDISALIRQWLSVAEPPENATEGAQMTYNAWGVKIGASATAVVTGTPGKPADVGARSSEQYCWDHRPALDSVNHCTLEEYVVAQLERASIDHCRGRYRPQYVTLPSLLGKSARQAEAELKQNGLQAEISGGDPAPSKQQEFKVADQNPGPGMRLKKGASVQLRIYSNYVPPQSPTFALPDLAGAKVQRAKSELEQKGLKGAVKGIGPAPSPAQEYTVKQTNPPAGTQVRSGAEVELLIYAAYEAQQTQVPALIGLSARDAAARLNDSGLKLTQKSRTAAPSAVQSFTVEAQDPSPGTQVAGGDTVVVWIYSAYQAVEPPPPIPEPRPIPEPPPVAVPPPSPPAQDAQPPAARRTQLECPTVAGVQPHRLVPEPYLNSDTLGYEYSCTYGDAGNGLLLVLKRFSRPEGTTPPCGAGLRREVVDTSFAYEVATLSSSSKKVYVYFSTSKANGLTVDDALPAAQQMLRYGDETSREPCE